MGDDGQKFLRGGLRSASVRRLLARRPGEGGGCRRWTSSMRGEIELDAEAAVSSSEATVAA